MEQSTGMPKDTVNFSSDEMLLHAVPTNCWGEAFRFTGVTPGAQPSRLADGDNGKGGGTPLTVAAAIASTCGGSPLLRSQV